MLQIVCPKKTQDLLEITSKRAHESIYFCTIVFYYDLGLELNGARLVFRTLEPGMKIFRLLRANLKLGKAFGLTYYT